MMLRLLKIEIVAIAAVLAVALDMYAHKRVEALGGVNYWGYRGPVANQRRPNEIRVAIVGGTRAFGWGAPASALASEIRRQIMLTTDQRGGELHPVVVINLGRLGALPDSYPAIIEHYSYLRPDYICLYDDLGVRGAQPAEGGSGVFALTGYAPALPLVLREKGMVWRYGDLKRGYDEESATPASAAPSASDGAATSHQPSVGRRMAGAVLEALGKELGAADRFAADRLAGGAGDASAGGAGYAGAMMMAVDAAHRHARGGVVVVVSPAETPEQAGHLRALAPQMRTALESAPSFRFVDLGTEAELSDATVRVDGWNYASAGIALVAAKIAPALPSLIRP
jgi:hypothetical protein